MTSPYPPPGGATPQPIYYTAPQRFEPLDRRAKRASFWAGAVGLNFMSAGASVLVATVLVGAALALFAGFSASATENSGLQGFDEFLGQVGAPILFLAAVLAGVVIFAIGMFASVGILKAGRVRRPWAVTWSAFAISLPVLWVVNGLAWIVGQFVATAGMFATFGTSFDGNSAESAPLGDASSVDSAVITGIVIASVGFLLTVAVVGLIGWLAWWWMAHVFRLRVPITDASGAAYPARASVRPDPRTNARRDDGGGGYYGGGYSDGGGNYTGRDNDGGSGWGGGDSGGGGGDGGGGGGGGGGD